MKHFSEPNFRDARGTVVGSINKLSVDERWERETPLFVDAIAKYLTPSTRAILDYGCGIGRISKKILEREQAVTITGVDASRVQIAHSLSYINDSRFSAVVPAELKGSFDLCFCIYVLQHVRAIDLRQTLWNIHSHLAPNALFIQCSSERRMSVRRDSGFFFDDRLLGVDLDAEIERLFEPVSDLFSREEIEKNVLLRKIMDGFDGNETADEDGNFGVVHRAKVYRKRDGGEDFWKLPSE